MELERVGASVLSDSTSRSVRQAESTLDLYLPAPRLVIRTHVSLHVPIPQPGSRIQVHIWTPPSIPTLLSIPSA